MIEPEYITWSVDGVEYKQVSPRYKQELLKDYAQRYGCKTFIETGSACGDTLSAMRLVGFHRMFSIELSDYYSGYVARRFEGQSDVTLIHGDSAVELAKLLATLPATLSILFWLDAHYSGGLTQPGPNPLEKELEAIFASGVGGAILIDDMEKLLEHCPANWQQEFVNGIVALTRRA